MDFACGSGSLLLNMRKKVNQTGGTIGKIFGQEKNITTYNLARMNMLLHGVKDTLFEIFHGDTVLKEWDVIREQNSANEPSFDAAEHFVKGKRQNQLSAEHIAKIIGTYQNRAEEKRYSRRVEMAEVENNEFNLNISCYISTSQTEKEVNLAANHEVILKAFEDCRTATKTHNGFLRKLKLPEAAPLVAAQRKFTAPGRRRCFPDHVRRFFGKEIVSQTNSILNMFKSSTMPPKRRAMSRVWLSKRGKSGAFAVRHAHR